MFQSLVFKAPNPLAPLSETNCFSVTVFHVDGHVSGWGLTLVESVEIAQHVGRAADAPADMIRLQGSTPGAVIGPENPLVVYSYSVPENHIQIADWIDRKVFKAATLAMQSADNQIPDTLEG